MRFFDGHCDTVMLAMDAGLDFVAGGQAHIDLPRLLATGCCLQAFAVFTAAGYYPHEGDLAEYAGRALEKIRSWADASDGRLKLALTAADIRAAGNDGLAGPTAQDALPARRVYGLLALEGADPLADRAENLHHYFAAGVRQVIPAWGDNAFSGTSTGSQKPLTEEGMRLIELCEDLGVLVDVSHLSDAAFWQVCDLARRPFVASHSDCRALCPHPRNLNDEMIRALAARGGVMGLNLAAYFLEPGFRTAMEAVEGPFEPRLKAAVDAAEWARLRAERAALVAALPRPDLTWAARHVRHAVQVGGEDCVGLGGDLDGVAAVPEGIAGIESYPALVAALRSAGLTERQIEKVCWRNLRRLRLSRTIRRPAC